MMKKTNSVSPQTRNNWLMDASLFISGLLALLTGIYFLCLPTNGFAGGRNPNYNLQLIFDRHTWNDLHTWGGVAMILIAIVHLVWHWHWFVNMSRRAWKELTSQQVCLNARGRWNLIVNAVIGLSFMVTAISGVYLLLSPSHSPVTSTPAIFFTRTTWDLIHTWAGVILSLAAILHFTIHWKWVVNVTYKIIGQPMPPRTLPQTASSPGK